MMQGWGGMLEGCLSWEGHDQNLYSEREGRA